MKIIPIKTRPLLPPKDDFFDALCAGIETLSEDSVVALSSKAVAIGEGRCVPIVPDTDVRALKEQLAQREADYFIKRNVGEHRHFTIIHGTLMGSAGIDESNGHNHLVLWPHDPMVSAALFRSRLQEKFKISNLGVVITDSHSIPLHNGAIGIAIGFAGFLPVKDYRGTLDLFGRLLKVERMNVADSLAVMASFTMGEGNECTPGVIMTQVPHVIFSENISIDENLQLTIPREKDYFNQFLGGAEWQKGGGGHIM